MSIIHEVRIVRFYSLLAVLSFILYNSRQNLPLEYRLTERYKGNGL